MAMESTVLHEISQRMRDRYRRITLICGIEKKDTMVKVIITKDKGQERHTKHLLMKCNALGRHKLQV